MNNPKASPTKTVAAAFLRDLARDAGLPVADPPQRAADLNLIADCIEGKRRWSKGRKRSYDQRMLIGKAAWAVEHRASDVPVKVALSDQVMALAKVLGEESEQQRQALRGEIEALRRLQRKGGYGKPGK